MDYNQDNQTQKDAYYEDLSRKAIERAVTETEGRELEYRRYVIRRSYPFGALRKGRPYKIWNRLVLEKEKELGIEPRKHKRA